MSKKTAKGFSTVGSSSSQNDIEPVYSRINTRLIVDLKGVSQSTAFEFMLWAINLGCIYYPGKRDYQLLESTSPDVIWINFAIKAMPCFDHVSICFANDLKMEDTIRFNLRTENKQVCRLVEDICTSQKRWIEDNKE